MAIHEDVVVSSQGIVRDPKGGIIFKRLFMDTFDALMIILVKYEDQQVSAFTMVGMRDKEG